MSEALCHSAKRVLSLEPSLEVIWEWREQLHEFLASALDRIEWSTRGKSSCYSLYRVTGQVPEPVSMFWRTRKFFTPAWSQRRFLCLLANILKGLFGFFRRTVASLFHFRSQQSSFITKVFSVLTRYDVAGHEYYYIRILLFRSGFSLRPCSGSDGQLPTCHLGVPVCFPDQSMCYLRPAKWQWDTFSPIT